MSDTQNPMESDTVDPREMRAAQRLATLERLGEIGMALAKALEQQVSDAAAAGDEIRAGAAARAYSRVLREVRRTSDLKDRLGAKITGPATAT
jgi:hypothetical protein